MSEKSRQAGSPIRYVEQSEEHGHLAVDEGELCNTERVVGRRSGPPGGVRYLVQEMGIGRG